MNNLISTIIERLVETANPNLIVLFGSYARGEECEDSDVDLLVIESTPFGRGNSRIAEIGRLERAIGSIPVPTDLLVFSQDELDRFRRSVNHIVFSALREGEVVYERS